MKTPRQKALASGKNYYFSKKPCKHGHFAKRHINNLSCTACVVISNANWAKKNRARINIMAKKRYPGRAEDAKNRNYKWRKDNKEKFLLQARITSAKRRTRERNSVGKFTRNDVENMLKKQEGKCKLCNKNIVKKFHIDHIKALSRGGSNWPSNLQLLCPTCNIKKHNK